MDRRTDERRGGRADGRTERHRQWQYPLSLKGQGVKNGWAAKWVQHATAIHPSSRYSRPRYISSTPYTIIYHHLSTDIVTVWLRNFVGKMRGFASLSCWVFSERALCQGCDYLLLTIIFILHQATDTSGYITGLKRLDAKLKYSGNWNLTPQNSCLSGSVKACAICKQFNLVWIYIQNKEC